MDTGKALREEIAALRALRRELSGNESLEARRKAGEISAKVARLLEKARKWDPPPARVESAEEREARLLPQADKVLEKLEAGISQFLEACRRLGRCPTCNQAWPPAPPAAPPA
jgi:hypothetical protein